MVHEPRLHNLLHVSQFPMGRNLQQDRLVEMLKLRQMLLEEPVLDRREWHGSNHFQRLCRPRFLLNCHQGQLSNCLMLKQLFRCQIQTGQACPSNDLHTENGVASQGKEVVVNPYRFPTQHLLPDGREALFYGRTGSYKGLLLRCQWEKMDLC